MSIMNRKAGSVHSLRGDSGVALLESLVALLILAIGVLGLLGGSVACADGKPNIKQQANCSAFGR